MWVRSLSCRGLKARSVVISVGVLAVLGLAAGCTPNSAPPQFVNSPVSGVSQPTTLLVPGSTPVQGVNIITCVADGAVIAAEVERLDTDGFNDEYIMFITDIGDVFSNSGSFPYQFVEAEGPVGATLVSDPIPGGRCL